MLICQLFDCEKQDAPDHVATQSYQDNLVTLCGWDNCHCTVMRFVQVASAARTVARFYPNVTRGQFHVQLESVTLQDNVHLNRALEQRCEVRLTTGHVSLNEAFYSEVTVYTQTQPTVIIVNVVHRHQVLASRHSVGGHPVL
ncbi:hypothetical protein BaRGS_00031433 [Batillaria attramentaria]|uniref:Uncharacterized protein n=1 Tax=Batillaria attramentaria TaxID=370345 RepID=A0ABD0JQC0_9CAEN